MADLKRSPLAPARFPDMPVVPGVELGAIEAGVRYKGRTDLMVARLAEGTVAAGVFTQTKTPAAPVDWCKQVLENSQTPKLLVVNSGNANAFTGQKGAKACASVAEIAASLNGCLPDDVLLASTGVIGEPLPIAPFKRALPMVMDGLSNALWHDSAKAIMTTDTFEKGASEIASIEGQPVILNGIAKGSGMIAPDMATMLGFVFTNANITARCLQAILSETTYDSFNAVTVDSDTSTNDTVLAFATCQAKHSLIDDPSDPRLENFKNNFRKMMVDLAHQLVRDGEGATKFVTITIEGAESKTAARTIGMAIANSPLVKTAIAGEDPNWGRLVMAVGKSGEAADRDSLAIWIGDQLVAHKGAVHNRYSEDIAAKHMQGQMIDIRMDVGVGEAVDTVYTCDLTHGYIEINADYRS